MPSYTRHILIVDDDPADRDLFAHQIRKLGYKVIAVGSADEAMAAVVDGKVGCLITDQSMPVRGGELAKIAASVRGDMGVIIFSGHPEPIDPIPPGVTFISKDDRPALIESISRCMAKWREGGEHSD